MRIRATIRKLAWKASSPPLVKRLRRAVSGITCEIVSGPSGVDDYARFLGKHGIGLSEESVGKLKDSIASRKEIMALARSHGKVIGHTSISPMWAHIGIPDQFSGGTWIHPAFRNMGVGSALLSAILREAGTRGIVEVLGNIAYDNEASSMMCEAVGFKIADRHDLTVKIQEDFLKRIGYVKRQTIVKQSLHDSMFDEGGVGVLHGEYISSPRGIPHD